MYDKSSLKTLNYHLAMLTDSVRTSSLQRAIESTVKQGDTVVDLGCGTGLLSYFACRAGARKVYAIEMNGIIDVARKISTANGFADRIVFINGMSTEVALPELADVIVTETVGNFGLEEGILTWMRDAKDRFLKPDGAIIPRTMQVFIAPVEHPGVYKRIDAWGTIPGDLDFSPARTMAANNVHWVTLQPENLLATPASLLSFDFARLGTNQVVGTAAIDIERDGIMHGLGGWFSLELAADLELTNAPPSRTPNWTHAVFPFERPVPVLRGDRIDVRFLCPPNSTAMNWRTELRRTKDGTPSQIVFESSQSSFFGQLFSRPMQNPDGRPTPTLRND
jgi:protein arginine N-methyltransferase 1